MTRLAFVILLATLSPAMAQDQPPPNLTTAGQGAQGGVARLFLSHQLFGLGTAAKPADRAECRPPCGLCHANRNNARP